MKKIRFVDLPAQVAEIRSEIVSFVSKTLDSCRFVGGDELLSFEEEFARYCGADWCVAVSSGTEALRLALVAHGIGPGHEVITVPNSFFATAASVSLAGARPVFSRVDPSTLLMDPLALESAVTSATRAIIPVHLFGAMADLDPIEELCRDRGITLIEDACQAHGAVYRSIRAGGRGNTACFSFYPGKNLGGLGEGGAVVGSDPEIEKKLRALRAHGQVEKNRHSYIGGNSHMDALNAGFLRIKLRRLDSWNRARRTAARFYRHLLADCPAIETPQEPAYGRSVYHLFPVLAPDRDLLRQRLAGQGIETGLHYPVPIHLQRAYSFLGYTEGSFPVVEKWAKNHLTLPMHPHLCEQDIQRIVDVVRDCL